MNGRALLLGFLTAVTMTGMGFFSYLIVAGGYRAELWPEVMVWGGTTLCMGAPVFGLAAYLVLRRRPNR